VGVKQKKDALEKKVTKARACAKKKENAEKGCG